MPTDQSSRRQCSLYEDVKGGRTGLIACCQCPNLTVSSYYPSSNGTISLTNQAMDLCSISC
ncbi:hypothetical protein DPMN_035201 [Dreissena polymorpha]|uniref:Uncharacterized protein n=1 Tax=Dreissena polymorpha TaxID=45954 RepID=A0A9D4M984_DREPO|nr:hypothetical protein DPMN_035201 [Dreissena polymorpha]